MKSERDGFSLSVLLSRTLRSIVLCWTLSPRCHLSFISGNSVVQNSLLHDPTFILCHYASIVYNIPQFHPLFNRALSKTDTLLKLGSSVTIAFVLKYILFFTLSYTFSSCHFFRASGGLSSAIILFCLPIILRIIIHNPIFLTLPLARFSPSAFCSWHCYWYSCILIRSTLNSTCVRNLDSTISSTWS